MKTLRDLKVGDRVMITDVNRRGARAGVVSKAGRTLLHVGGDFRTETFRIDTGRSNDGYGHRRAMTEDQYAQIQAVADARKRLADFGLESYGGRMTPEKALAVDAALAKEIVGYLNGGDRGLRLREAGGGARQAGHERRGHARDSAGPCQSGQGHRGVGPDA